MALADAIEKFSKTPPQTRVLAIVAVSALLGVGFYFLFYAELTEQVASLENQVSVAQSEKAKYEDRKQRYRAFRAEVNQLLEDQKELLKVLPDRANISTFLQSVHAQAELAGVNILTYDQRPERRRDFYAKIPVRLTISGTYHQIAKFLYYMEKDVKRIVKVRDVALTSPKVTSAGLILKAQFEANTFRFAGKKRG